MTTTRRYPPAVYWLPDKVRRALRFETLMQQVAAAAVDPADEDEGRRWLPAESPAKLQAAALPNLLPEPEPVPAVAPPPFGRFAQAKEPSDVEEYHERAVAEAKVFPCRTADCLHFVPVPGDPCPVCSDKGRKSLFEGRGDAA